MNFEWEKQQTLPGLNKEIGVFGHQLNIDTHK
jgi:hypothetical protein